MAEAEPPAPLTEEQRLEAQRETWRVERAGRRQRQAEERARAADQPGTVPTPPMPAGLRAMRRWLRRRHDAYERGEITSARLAEQRRTVSALGDTYRVGAELRKAEAAIRAAEAQERMAELLASFEHGGAVVGLLASLRAGDAALGGPRPRLPRPTTAALVRRPDGDGA
jgi:hypothetical protein